MLSVGTYTHLISRLLRGLNLAQLLIVFTLAVGIFGVAFPQTTYADDGTCSKNAASDDKCFEDNYKKVGGSTSDYNKAVDGCVSKNGVTWTSWYDNSRASCSNALVSCVGKTTDRGRCFSDDVLAEGASSNNGNHAYDDWRTIQSKNGMPGRDNEKAREYRLEQLEPLIDARCDKITDATANKKCRDEVTDAFNTCYEDLGGNRTNIEADALAQCIAQKVPDLKKEELGKAFGSNADAAAEDAGGGSASGTKNNCQVQKSGWLVCSITEFLADIATKIYESVIRDLMNVPPINISPGSSNNLYTAWELMRNIANVAFVVVFLIIIYSQVTSMGLNNYGIKRMLPRLIIAAILVNVSYWICALGVDISNILGNALYEAFTNLNNTGSAAVKFDIDDKGFTSQGSGWVTLALAILASATVVYLGLSILLPAIITVIVACITVIIALTMRQALIILLIVISPLAFVAYLLPNTESMFKKWLKLFQTLLLLYPMIALLFGAAGLAGTILQQSSKLMLVQIMGAVLPVLPAVLIPKLIAMAGGILGKVGAFMNNPNKGPFDRARKGAEGYRNRSQDRRAIRSLSGGTFNPSNVLSGGKFRRQTRRQAIDGGTAKELQRAQQQYTAQSIKDSPGFQNRVAGGSFQGDASPAAMQRALAGANFTIDKANLEEIQAARLSIESLDLGQTQGMLPGQGPVSDASAQQQAAIQKTVESMDIKGIDQLLNASKSWGNSEAARSLQKTLADSLAKSRPGYVGQSDIAAIRTGNNGGAEDMRVNALQSGAYSAEKIAGADKDELQAMYATAQSRPAAMTPGRRKFIDNAQKAATDSVLGAKMGKNANVIDNIRNLP